MSTYTLGPGWDGRDTLTLTRAGNIAQYHGPHARGLADAIYDTHREFGPRGVDRLVSLLISKQTDRRFAR